MYGLKEASDVDKKAAGNVCAKHVAPLGTSHTERKHQLGEDWNLIARPRERCPHSVLYGKCAHAEIGASSFPRRKGSVHRGRTQSLRALRRVRGPRAVFTRYEMGTPRLPAG